MDVLRVPGREFFADYFAINPGEHVSLIGPTGTGKTTAGMRLLPELLTQCPEMRAVVLAMKPHRRGGFFSRRTGDPTVERYARQQGAKIIRTWGQHRWYRQQRMFVLWPVHRFDDGDDYRHHMIFAECLRETYRAGNWAVFADELSSLVDELKLTRALGRIWSKGRSMDTALIGATQRPTHVPRYAYSAPTHLFLWRDPDADARRRYREISGVDSHLVESVLSGLDRHSALYLRQSDKTMCIVQGD